jgi:hypothetical protein
MPTGYTSMLEQNPNLSTEQWVLTGLARAFGICITLKEEPMNLTEKQILERLSEDDSVNYNIEAQAKAKADCELFAKRSEEDWRKAWELNEIERVKSNNESAKRTKKIADRHDKVMSDLKHLYISDKIHPLTKNIIKFGIEQLNLVKDEGKPFIIPAHTLEEYKEIYIESAKKDLAYHNRELKEAKKRQNERLQAYKDLIADLSVVSRNIEGKDQ